MVAKPIKLTTKAYKIVITGKNVTIFSLYLYLYIKLGFGINFVPFRKTNFLILSKLVSVITRIIHAAVTHTQCK